MKGWMRVFLHSKNHQFLKWMLFLQKQTPFSSLSMLLLMLSTFWSLVFIFQVLLLSVLNVFLYTLFYHHLRTNFNVKLWRNSKCSNRSVVQPWSVTSEYTPVDMISNWRLMIKLYFSIHLVMPRKIFLQKKSKSFGLKNLQSLAKEFIIMCATSDKVWWLLCFEVFPLVHFYFIACFDNVQHSHVYIM